MRTILLLFLISIPHSFLGQLSTISSISFETLTRTKPDFLLSRLDFQTGDSVSLEEVEKNTQYLRNLNLFLSVDFKVDSLSNSKIGLIFILEEASYVYPIFSIGGFDEKLNLLLGVGDINFLGKAQHIGFIYNYYDRHSFTFYQNAPMHKNRRTGHEFVLGKRSTLEPLYFGSASSRFNFDNYHVSIGGYLWVNRFLNFGLGTMVMYENYENREVAIITPGKTFAVGDQFNFWKLQVRANATFNAINYFFERRNGIKNTLYAENIATANNPNASFFKVTNELNFYKFIGKSGNLNLRNRIGIATNNNSPFSPFVIDGFVNVRGSGDRIARGTGEMILNLEYTHTVWRNKLCFVMVNSFFDMGFLRPPGEGFNKSFETSNSHAYYGAGLKIQSRKFYNTLLRLDFGLNTQNYKQNGFTFGFGHFF